MSQNFYSAISASNPDGRKSFIETPDGRRLTYGDVETLSGRIAGALLARGVAPGDRVAVQVEKSPEAILLYLACLRAGAAYLPLNTAYTIAELEYFLGDAEPRLTVCMPERAAEIGTLVSRLGTGGIETLGGDGTVGTMMDLAARQPAEFEDVARQDEDLAAILYTSGTTGRSKGAMLTHRNLASNAAALRETWRFTETDVLLHALPIFHTHGLFVATNVVLLAGASMLFLPKFDVDQIFRLMPRATSMMGVPTFYMRLLQDPRLDRRSTEHMRLFVSGSAPLLADTHREWLERTGHSILERYGMTETGMNTSNPYDGERVSGSVGLPLPGIEIRVTDPQTGAVLGENEIGMIEVRGPNVFKGYWRMPDKTRAEFRPDGFFITGDLGKIDGRGYVTIVGRGKDLVITGGYNVYPKEVEREIDSLPQVLESAVIGVPHPDFGEGVAAVVTLREGANLDERQILSALRRRLASYKLPKRIVFTEDLPRNAMGKVQKNLLRERYGSLFRKGAKEPGDG
jgi:malonyl-CoA/methylmalonyl-CoA synthetase